MMKRKQFVLGLALLVMFTVASIATVAASAEKFCFQVPNCTGNNSCSGEVISTSGCTITCISGSTETSKDCPRLHDDVDDNIEVRPH